MAGQLFSVNSLGGFLDNSMLSEKMRMAAQPLMRFRMHVDAEAERGELNGGGDTVLFQKIRNVDTAGSSLSETSTIPKTQFQIVRSSLVMNEFGNSVPFTEKLTVTSKMNVPEMTQTALRNDMSKTLDNQAFLKFSGSDYLGVVTNTATSTITSSGTTPGGAAGGNMSDKNVRDFIDDMKKKNVPTRANGMYKCLSSTNGIRGLYDFFESKANLTTLSVAKSGNVGEYYGWTNTALLAEAA